MRILAYGLLTLIMTGCASQVLRQQQFAMSCVKGDKAQVEKQLTENHIDINSTNGTIGPCLVSASYAGNLELVRALLDRGADVNVTDLKGGTPLSYAVVGNKSEIVELLLSRQADPNIILPDENGKKTDITALKLARVRGNADIIRMLENASSRK